MKAFFVSDIHVTALDDPRAVAFLRFLKSLRGADGVTHLFFVGDIFDLWIGAHRYFINKFEPIVNELRRLRSEHVEIHYMEGNHDLHLENFWQHELGACVYKRPSYLSLGPYRLRIEHGDEINRDDYGYFLWKRVLHFPLSKKVMLALPDRFVARVGEGLSSASRRRSGQRRAMRVEDLRQKIRTHAEAAFASRPFDFVISGHVHVRDDYEIARGGEKGRSINLGSWFEQPCAFEISDEFQGFRLL